MEVPMKVNSITKILCLGFAFSTCAVQASVLDGCNKEKEAVAQKLDWMRGYPEKVTRNDEREYDLLKDALKECKVKLAAVGVAKYREGKITPEMIEKGKARIQSRDY